MNVTTPFPSYNRVSSWLNICLTGANVVYLMKRRAALAQMCLGRIHIIIHDMSNRFR